MSKDIKIELVWGCEGDCLVMNDYRIAGPKPWGGGRTIQTFYTTEGDILTAYKFKELAKVKQQLAIAVEALDSLRGICNPLRAEQALQQIRELDK